MIKSIDSLVPYEGSNPYIFISYAHADDESVLPLIEEIGSRGYNVWFDDGIEVGSEWQECIARHLEKASLVISFISNAYVRSTNCRKELNFALSRGINVINIYLEDTALTPGIELQISSIFALFKYSMKESIFKDKLFNSPLMLDERLRDTGTAELPAAQPEMAAEKSSKKAPKNRQKAKKGKALKIILGILIPSAIIAAAVCGYIFGTAIPAARRNAVYSKEEATKIAEEYLSEYLGTDVSKYILNDVDRFLDSSAGLKNTVYRYEVDFRDENNEFEYDVSVNAQTGYARLVEMDER